MRYSRFSRFIQFIVMKQGRIMKRVYLICFGMGNYFQISLIFFLIKIIN